MPFHKQSIKMNNNNIFNKFSNNLKNVLKNAVQTALHFHAMEISPDFLLYGLSQQTGSLATEIIKKSGLDTNLIQKKIKEKHLLAKQAHTIKSNHTTITDFSINSKQAIKNAALIAAEHKHKYIGTEHLLMAVINLKDNNLDGILPGENINVINLREQLTLLLKDTSKFPDPSEVFQKNNTQADELYAEPPSALNCFALELTSKKAQQKIDPVFCRDEEIERLIQILMRRNKNNPVLLGEAGVGKTAIAEGLAKKIYAGDVPEILMNKKIYNLDLGLLIAGTIYRGEFENRLKQVLEEVKQNPDIILFIDEIHNIIGTGSASGSMDAANILKPCLARGEIRCIGATTLEEYRKTIENDAALERRFQPIVVDEPTAKKTLDILNGLKIKYENYHQVRIDEEALQAAVELSQRFITDRYLPDKAIDLVDEASSKIKIKHSNNGQLKELYAKKEKLHDITQKKNHAVKTEAFQKALYYKSLEKKLKEKINIFQEKLPSNKEELWPSVSRKDIVDLVSGMTKIPLTDLIDEEKNQLLNLENKLAEKIIGQDEALQEIATLVRRAKAGLANQGKPTASLLFLGPSGVGKTETAKVMAETIFGSTDSLVKIDMSEFSEKFNISKLIGAPAGYVGYKENKITDKIRTKPYSLVLFDEIEKAHTDVHHLLLQILDEGSVTDATGRKINFQNTIIVMTSNLGAKEIMNNQDIGFEKQDDQGKHNYEKIKEKLLDQATKHFSPEFINRLNKNLVFRPLTISDLEIIAKLHLKQLQSKLAEQQIKISFAPSLAKSLAKQAAEVKEGARIIERLVSDLVENELSKKIIKGTIKKNNKVKIGLKKDKIIIEKLNKKI